MSITINISPKAEQDLYGLDASVKPDVESKLNLLAQNWPNVPKKGLTGPLKNHFRVQVRKDWRIVVLPERGGLTVVRILHRSDRSYGTSRDQDRNMSADYVLVPRAFVRASLRGKLTRNFAAEYVRWSLGQDLRAARLTAGLTQQELASRVRKAQSTISMAEKGQIRVSSTYVRAILKACRVPSDWSGRHWMR